MSVPPVISKLNHGKPPVCADQDSAWLPLESLSGCVDDPLRGFKVKFRELGFTLGFTLGGLGVAVGLDGRGVGDGAGVADGCDAGDSDADFEVGDRKGDVN